MNDKANQEIQKLVQSCIETCEAVRSKYGMEFDVQNILKVDLMRFMMYLSASDGKIAAEEAKTVSDVVGLEHIHPENLADLIKEWNVYTETFERTVPAILRFAVTIDNAIYNDGKKADLAHHIIELYKAAGALLIQTDNNIDEREKRDYSIYIQMLESYRTKTSKIAQTPVAEKK